VSSVFEDFLSTPEMLALFDAPSIVQAMLDFEAALARAQAAEGVIAPDAARAIAAACRVELLDVPALVAAGARAGSLAIALVRQLTAVVERSDAAAARHVHWGSTSQDAIDTAAVLATRRALALIERDLDRLVEALFALERHADAPLLARTLLQPAQVTSFGLALANWIAPLARGRARLREAAARALQLQLGGAVGTLSVMGERAPAVARRMAEALSLRLPPAPWHTQRDDWVALGTALGVLTGSLAKLARDWSLMSQGEVGEVAEAAGAGRGGSSAMPHKRNPVGCTPRRSPRGSRATSASRARTRWSRTARAPRCARVAACARWRRRRSRPMHRAPIRSARTNGRRSSTPMSRRRRRALEASAGSRRCASNGPAKTKAKHEPIG